MTEKINWFNLNMWKPMWNPQDIFLSIVHNVSAFVLFIMFVFTLIFLYGLILAVIELIKKTKDNTAKEKYEYFISLGSPGFIAFVSLLYTTWSDNGFILLFVFFGEIILVRKIFTESLKSYALNKITNINLAKKEKIRMIVMLSFFAIVVMYYCFLLASATQFGFRERYIFYGLCDSPYGCSTGLYAVVDFYGPIIFFTIVASAIFSLIFLYGVILYINGKVKKNLLICEKGKYKISLGLPYFLRTVMLIPLMLYSIVMKITPVMQESPTFFNFSNVGMFIVSAMSAIYIFNKGFKKYVANITIEPIEARRGKRQMMFMLLFLLFTIINIVFLSFAILMPSNF